MNKYFFVKNRNAINAYDTLMGMKAFNSDYPKVIPTEARQVLQEHDLPNDFEFGATSGEVYTDLVEAMEANEVKALATSMLEFIEEGE